MTYAEAGKHVAILANVLKEKYGIKKGDHVAIAMVSFLR